ncbi:MAG: hypothetical protein NTZ46_11045 [Verrucomicrobia bacterium]|nr:hypothetical protein [Verrucomicrobiota bacterium]
MNRFSQLLAVAALATFFASQARLNSQENRAAAKTPTELLAALRASNAELLLKQQKTLQKLEEMKLQADQLRILAKRS